VAASEAEVCNLALLLVGQTQFIDDLTDPTEAGEVCKQVYERARDAALEAVAWPFATRRADLNEITDGDRDGWGYAYTLPSDCLAPRWLEHRRREPFESQKVPFDIEDDATVGKGAAHQRGKTRGSCTRAASPRPGSSLRCSSRPSRRRSPCTSPPGS
jgi:hypothetical protein